MNSQKKSTHQKEIEVVLARLEVISPDLYFSSGNAGQNISRDEMIKHVEANDEIGQKFVKAEWEFLRALKDGSLMNHLISA